MHYSDSVLARNAWQIMALSAYADIAVSQFFSSSISLFTTTPMKQEYLHNNINNMVTRNKNLNKLQC